MNRPTPSPETAATDDATDDLVQIRESVPRPVATPHGRGAVGNPRNRFERLEVEVDDEVAPEDAVSNYSAAPDRVPTEVLRDTSRTIIATNDSPDIPFDASINPYRGCEHGCTYCYARPTHEYLGFSAGLDFESRILAKEDAADLLRRELTSPRWQPKTLALSGVTDPYQPVERKLGVTRGCLEVLAEVRNPVAVITKSRLVTRDLDLLAELAAHGAVRVALSVTSLDVELARKLEPRAASPEARLRAIRELAEAGIPVSVMVAPVIPGLTEHEIPSILQAAADAGADSAGYVPLRLPGAVAPLFAGWLEAHFPERREKVLNRVRGMRGGRLNDPRFGKRMRGEGVFADQIRTLFTAARKRAGLERRGEPLSSAAFRRKGIDQMDLFP